MKVNFKPVKISDMIKYFNANFENYSLKMTTYTSEVDTGNNKYFFANSPMSKKVFIYYNMIKSDIKGEVREVNKEFQYYDFTGLNSAASEMWCVDINSAYLSVLNRDGILNDEKFKIINSMAKKVHRLKAVGMFARAPVFLFFEKGEVKKYTRDPDPYSWVFFHAVRETFLAMNRVKELLQKDYVFYWVDGIFIKGNPQKAVDILKELGFNSKIEKITEFKQGKTHLSFKKDGEQKVLFLPRHKKISRSEIQSIIKNSITV